MHFWRLPVWQCFFFKCLFSGFILKINVILRVLKKREKLRLKIAQYLLAGIFAFLARFSYPFEPISF